MDRYPSSQPNREGREGFVKIVVLFIVHPPWLPCITSIPKIVWRWNSDTWAPKFNEKLSFRLSVPLSSSLAIQERVEASHAVDLSLRTTADIARA